MGEREPEVFMEEHGAPGSFLKGNYVPEVLKMGQSWPLPL